MDAKSENTKGPWLRHWMKRLYKIPVAGYFLRILTAILNLPQIMRNIDEYQAATDARFSGKADREAVDALHPIIAEKADRTTLEALTHDVAGKADREAPEEARRFDAMYIDFEDRFRGTREEIEQKLRVYLPLIAALGAEKEKIALLDVGCGRGEWLELLRAEGYRACGTDINRVALQQCRKRGLEVAEADLIDHLKGLERGSMDVITGFHVIEHLPFPVMVALFDEAFAVLKPGGMIILETPNPTNILVSAYDFYRDPGHIRPLHPDTVQFIAENRGFVRAGAYFVSGDRGAGTLIPSADWKLNNIGDYIRAPRDFALIGYKPS